MLRMNQVQKQVAQELREVAHTLGDDQVEAALSLLITNWEQEDQHWVADIGHWVHPIIEFTGDFLNSIPQDSIDRRRVEVFYESLVKSASN